ncbi:uncharacterized protein LOC119670629 [Teleopsis dalmanni]|uniref:uncharacterized protein LOC119670629 n=1 Tax=Teleopsis dalmanni TaxID=139649 RepID=UPI0018CEE5D5|nr:uncharacterized protein LOC119670629 [Teleopsis dalmanni]
MHNAMFPGTAKFQTRPASPQFANFSPPLDYPHNNGATVGMPTGATALGPPNSHHMSMSMRHPKTMSSKTRSNAGHHMVNSNTMGMMAGGIGGGSLGHHRGDLIFPDETDTIEFCMPPPPATGNGMSPGMNGELLLHSNNGFCNAEAFTERRRRGQSRRSNHKMDVEQQVKWSRKNIAATMERFEPTNHSSSSTSSLEYGFAAGVVTPSTTPSHQSQVSPVQQSYPCSSNSMAGAAAPMNHIYSYAYYEPGAAKCHTNIPMKDGSIPAIIPAPQPIAGPSKSPPRNSIRALLAKGFRSKSNSGQSTSSSPSADDRHTYTTRYGTTENLYEEVSEQKIRKVLSDNRIASSNGNVKEELRRVQHNHFRVLDELNLSLEALIMPPTPPDVSPNHVDDDDEPTTSAAAAAALSATTTTGAAAAAQRPRRIGLLGGASSSSSTSSQQRTLSHASLENLSTTLNSIELKDHAHSSCINPEFDEGDLDSGFSGSGSSSGASYNESLRYYKTGTNHMQTTTLPHNLRSCRSSTASGTSTSKSSMASSEDQGIGMMSAMGGCGITAATAGNSLMTSPFNYARRCSDTQRASARSASATSATGTKPKKNFWTIKP